MIIKNFSSLSTSKERKDALSIINSGIEAVLTKPAMRRQISKTNNILKIQNKSWNLNKYKRIFVIGAGKAALDMAEVIQEILGDKITKGILIDTREKNLKNIKVVKGTHPIPSKVNVIATNEIISILKESKKDDLILCLMSGGGSALLISPRIPLNNQIEVTKMLLKRGANIGEINTVRKHISFVKGGQLAKLAEPSEIITLIISDVITNDLNVIASGPTVKDPTTISDAIRVAKKYKLPSLPFVETPKNNPKNAVNILLITNIPAAKAMEIKAKSLGYKAKIISYRISGEARKLGKELAQNMKKNTALIAVGESTVTIHGHGKGGRNQELALTAANYIKSGVVVSSSSDGVDFITDAAGGITDQNTKKEAKKKNISIGDCLKNNDSYNALRKLNGLIHMNKTGTNIGDVIIALRK